ncbi:hypothetical protein [Glaciimonas sp. PCH181]|uniref:hypothetical protein n=1 Tax=Glaciimonas sp. PCH181 TaxID=2133943 RepID=UPI000D378175|nr:hypothetical protein [Glaciimonas sp. PCH181]PUA17303.1 hypothetical protein C7W93_15360 [Glaciimonas sp. PCH181]
MRNASQQLTELKKLVVVLRACTHMSIKTAPAHIQAHPLFPFKHPRGSSEKAGFSRVPLWDAIDALLAAPVALDVDVRSAPATLGNNESSELIAARLDTALAFLSGKGVQQALMDMLDSGRVPPREWWIAKFDRDIQNNIGRQG